MDFGDFLKNLQDKPDHIKTRIIWGTSALAAVVIVGVWFTNFQKQVTNISGTDIINLNTQQSSESAPHYFKIENAEQKGGQLFIYFMVENDTNDILNFSPKEDVSLTLGDNNKYTPSNILNRQNQQFAKKVLSHSQTWGILTFDNVSGNSGSITFDNLYFEQGPDTIFKETLELELSKLRPPQTIRN